MSKRFIRWAETWIEENIPPGANHDLESHDARAKRLSHELFTAAEAARFKDVEREEDRAHISSLVLTAVSDSTDFDIRAYDLKVQLAQENEDGD